MWNVSFCGFCLRLDSERPISTPLNGQIDATFTRFFNGELPSNVDFFSSGAAWKKMQLYFVPASLKLHRRHMGCGGSGSVAPSFPPCCFSRTVDIAQEDKRSQLMTCLGTLIASILIVHLCIWRGQQCTCTRGTRSSREKVRKLNISATDERKWDPFVCARSIFGIVDLF